MTLEEIFLIIANPISQIINLIEEPNYDQEKEKQVLLNISRLIADTRARAKFGDPNAAPAAPAASLPSE